jgi:hypothetical protein
MTAPDREESASVSEATTLAARIAAEAPRFEIAALLDLLAEHFPERPIQFCSHPSAALAPTVVHAVVFGTDVVRVVVNVGLLSASSPLPSYFRERLLDPRGGPALRALLEVLDHGLLSAELATWRPEAMPHFVADAPRLRRDLLAAGGLATPARLEWIFRAVFPEFTLSVERAPLTSRLPTARARIGSATLGRAVLGGETRAPRAGFRVKLITAESSTWFDEPWVDEVGRRLERAVLPTLRGTELRLQVWLVDLEAAGALTLASSQRLGLASVGPATAPRLVSLFDGVVA